MVDSGNAGVPSGCFLIMTSFTVESPTVSFKWRTLPLQLLEQSSIGLPLKHQSGKGSRELLLPILSGVCFREAVLDSPAFSEQVSNITFFPFRQAFL